MFLSLKLSISLGISNQIFVINVYFPFFLSLLSRFVFYTSASPEILIVVTLNNLYLNILSPKNKMRTPCLKYNLLLPNHNLVF